MFNLRKSRLYVLLVFLIPRSILDDENQSPLTFRFDFFLRFLLQIDFARLLCQAELVLQLSTFFVLALRPTSMDLWVLVIWGRRLTNEDKERITANGTQAHATKITSKH